MTSFEKQTPLFRGHVQDNDLFGVLRNSHLFLEDMFKTMTSSEDM
jgi:hypothetical protein